MRASLQLALPAVPREFTPARTNSNSAAALEQDSATRSSFDEANGESPSSFRSILRDSSQSQEDTNQENNSPRPKPTIPVHPSRPAREISQQAAPNPAAGQSDSKANALRQNRGTQSGDSDHSTEDGKQPSDSKDLKSNDQAAASEQTPQVSQVLPLAAKIAASLDGIGSTDENGDLQGDSGQPDDSKKASVNTLAIAGYAPSRETIRLIAALPVLPGGSGLPQQSSSQSSPGTQSQAAIVPPETSSGTAENEAAPSAEPAQPERIAPPPMFDVSSTTQAASTGPIAFAAKLTPVDADASTPVTADAGSRGQIPFQKQGFGSNSVQDEGNIKLGADPAPESLMKAEAAFAPVAPAAASSTDAPKNTAAATASTAAQTDSQMEPLIETPGPAAGSGHDITIKVPDATDRGMDVRFVERGGEVHVAFRTSDGEMAQTLRSGMNDFAGRMEHAGIRAEVWRPSADTASSQNSQDDARQQSPDQNGSRNQSGPQDRESDSQNSKKPRWVEAMEESIGSQSSQIA